MVFGQIREDLCQSASDSLSVSVKREFLNDLANI